MTVAVMPYTSEERAGLMRHRNCPICSADDTLTLQEFRDFQFFADGRAPRVTLRDVQCQRCWAIYKNPTYTDTGMQVLFAQASASYGAEHPDERVAEQVAWMVTHGLTDDVLDYGCASGRFLAALPPGRRMGLDLDPVALADAKAAHPDILFYNDAEQEATRIPWSPLTVTLWHTLEHVEHPYALLSQLHTRKPVDYFCAQPVPRLVVEVPVLEHGFTDDICGFFSPQHTTHFSIRSLHNLLWVAGWQADLYETMPYNGRRVLAHGVSPQVPPTAVKGAPQDAQLAASYLVHHRNACAKVDRWFRAGVGDRPYVLWGAGMHTECLFHETSLKHHLPYLIVDGDPGKQGTTWRGVRVEQPYLLRQQVGWDNPWDTMPLVISSFGSQRAMVAEAIALGVPESDIVTLYEDPNVY